jgi:hypothetical protein
LEKKIKKALFQVFVPLYISILGPKKFLAAFGTWQNLKKNVPGLKSVSISRFYSTKFPKGIPKRF